MIFWCDFERLPPELPDPFWVSGGSVVMAWPVVMSATVDVTPVATWVWPLMIVRKVVVYCCTDVATRGVVLMIAVVRIIELCASLDSAGVLLLGAGVVLGASGVDAAGEDAAGEDVGAEVGGADDCSSLGDGAGVDGSAADEGSGVELGAGVSVVAGAVLPVPLACRLFPWWR
jgi:hypothetical protein